VTADPFEALERFRAHVMADEALQMELARCERPDAFAAAAVDIAARAGIALTADSLKPLLRPDPLGLFLFQPAPQSGASWPGRDWLPVQTVGLTDGGLAVDWAHFAGAPLSEPMFALSARRAAGSPFNRLFRYRTGIDDFIDGAPDSSPEPAGFIFHMSRCGSTLVSRMLAALPDILVLSEPPPLDAVVKLAMNEEGLGPDSRATRALPAMIGALVRGQAGRPVVKLDSWQAMALPAFRSAFPSVPWIFLYREPVEILVSLMTLGTPTLQLPGQAFDGAAAEGPDAAAGQCARSLAGICNSAIAHAGDGGLLVNYNELPDAIGRILAHFAIVAGPKRAAAMKALAALDAKEPTHAFVADAVAKRDSASPAVRSAAERYLAGPYRRLEQLRIAQGA
jgi:hypothetical protein